MSSNKKRKIVSVDEKEENSKESSEEADAKSAKSSNTNSDDDLATTESLLWEPSEMVDVWSKVIEFLT